MIPIKDTIRSRDLPVVTWALILINVLVFLHELSLPPEYRDYLIDLLGMVPVRLRTDPDSWWTLLTSMFLHGGWIHLIGNMWVLFLFGDAVEDRMGSARYLIFYLLCGLAAGLMQYFADPSSNVPGIGASGAIAGVLGAYLLLFPTAQVITLIPILFIPFIVEIPAVFFLMVWFFSQLFNGTLAVVNPQLYEGVAWWAHVGGFLTGMALLPLFKKSRKEYRRYYADEYWPW